MTNLRLGIAGLGTVGMGVINILKDKKELMAVRAGKEIEITAVSARDKSKDRGVDLSDINWCDNAVDIASLDDVDVVIELIGGDEGVAYDLCKGALENSKSVVTANKALIAKHGLELAKIAEKNNVALLFEASVAGGIPIIKTLKEGLAANNISRVSGILNGTCNYILTAMKRDKRAFDDVLKEAQELGYAESDPSFDVGGIDAAHKLAIVTSLAFGCPVDFDAIYIEGIENITTTDIEYAKDFGYTIKLLAISAMTEKGVAQKVHPCLIPNDSQIANVDGVLNAVFVETDSLGPLLLTGAGAGDGPTASSIIADIIDIANGRASLPLAIPVDSLKDVEFIDIENREGAYYIRVKVEDKPGVLASITTQFSEEGIGVGSVLQRTDNDSTAQIALITHQTNELSIGKALENISKMEYVKEAPKIIRVEEL